VFVSPTHLYLLHLKSIILFVLLKPQEASKHHFCRNYFRSDTFRNFTFDPSKWNL